MERIATVGIDMPNQSPQTCEICGKPYIQKQYSRFKIYVPDCK